MIRVGDLTQYTGMPASKMAPFPGERPRTVRFTFNAPHRTALYVHALTPDGEMTDEDPYFLAVVDGLTDVEFYAYGSFGLTADADVWLRTVDGTDVHVVVPDAQTYTRIAERRARNPEIEALQAMLLKNQERRMGGMFEEMRIERQRLERDRQALNSAARPSGGNSPPAEPASGSGEPAAGPAAAPTGNEGGKVDS